MKALQPEMARLKDLHKDDKMKLQQEMMALYKKEKGKPDVWLFAHTCANSSILCVI